MEPATIKLFSTLFGSLATPESVQTGQKEETAAMQQQQGKKGIEGLDSKGLQFQILQDLAPVEISIIGF